jgi:hypothetical protein
MNSSMATFRYRLTRFLPYYVALSISFFVLLVRFIYTALSVRRAVQVPFYWLFWLFLCLVCVYLLLVTISLSLGWVDQFVCITILWALYPLVSDLLPILLAAMFIGPQVTVIFFKIRRRWSLTWFSLLAPIIIGLIFLSLFALPDLYVPALFTIFGLITAVEIWAWILLRERLGRAGICCLAVMGTAKFVIAAVTYVYSPDWLPLVSDTMPRHLTR